MNVMSQTGGAAAIHGHSFTLGPDRLLAIYERNGVAWVAEFHGSRGEFTYAGAWFRSDFGGLRYCHNRRAAHQSSMPLTAEMVERIERLHQESVARHERVEAVPRNIAAAMRRWWLRVISRSHGGGCAGRQTLD